MAAIHQGRCTAEVEGDFVVFLIGMRLNRPWKLHHWWPVLFGMRRMLAELAAHPERGLLGAHTGLLNGGPAVVQYWRSFEHLERFARDPGDLHLPAWRWFNRAVKASGDVGIWHETYLVPSGRYEAIYGSMPRIGLAAAGAHVPIARRGESAAERVGTRANDEVEAST
jgi:Domain of unknown function (DUF4188)